MWISHGGSAIITANFPEDRIRGNQMMALWVSVPRNGYTRWARHVACIGERGDAYRVLVGNPEGRRAL
jgi:hypothetical protein